MSIKNIILMSIFCLVFFGCDDDENVDDGCVPEATRCNNNMVEVCNTQKNWELEMDCAEIEDFDPNLNWKCCLDPLEGFHLCLPDEC